MMIRESGEMYLETILILRKKQEIVRAIDVANERKFSKPSVSRAINVLKEKGLVIVEKNGNLLLTSEGEKLAKTIYERHKIITRYLVDVLGVSQSTAEDDACRIEHVISDETITKIKELLK